MGFIVAIELVVVAACMWFSIRLKRSCFELPLDRDYGTRGYVAWMWLRGKGLIYKDIDQSHTPLVNMIYMWIIKHRGISRESFRLFFAQYNCVTLAVVYLIGRVAFGSWGGMAGAVMYCMYSSVPSLWWHFSQTENYLLLPTALTLLCVLMSGVMPEYQLVWSFGAGIFAGLAFLGKQTTLINTGAPAAVALVWSHWSFWPGLVYVAGYILPFGWFVYYFLFKHKVNREFLPLPFNVTRMIKLAKKKEGYLSKPTWQASNAAFHSHRKRLKEIHTDHLVLAVFGFAGCLYLLLTASGDPAIVIPLMAGGAVVGTILGSTYLPYHFVPNVLPLAVGCSAIFAALIDAIPGASPLVIALGGGTVFILFFCSWYHLINDVMRMPANFLSQFYGEADVLFDDCEKIGKYIKMKTDENDTVYSWGSEQEIYLWSERRNPSRRPWSIRMYPHTLTQELRDEEYKILRENKPLYFVVTQSVKEYREFEYLLRRYYDLEKQTEYAMVFRRKDSPVAAPASAAG